MEQSFLASNLERHGVKGWIGSTGVSEANFRKVAEARTNFVLQAINYARSQDIMSITKEMTPAHWKKLEESLPHTKDTMDMIMDVARDRLPLTKLDRTVIDSITKLTGERFSYRAPLWGLQKIRGALAAKDLAWSAAYHTANAVQPIQYGSTALLREYARIGRGDPITALLSAEKEFASPSLKTKEALEWAARNKVITPKLMEEIDFLYKDSPNRLKETGKEFATGRRASELNEAAGRAQVYLQGYLYYKSTGKMNEMQSRRAAAKFTNDVMVDYSPTGQPLWIANNPMGQIVSRLVAPYAAFQFSHWGHVALVLQQIKNNPAVAKTYLPLLQLEFGHAALAGMRGITGLAELSAGWIAVAAAWEAAFNEKFPIKDPITMLAESGADDFWLFGALSSVTKVVPGLEGADVGKTLTAPELSDLAPGSMRQAQGVWDLLRYTVVGLGKIITGNASDADKLLGIKAITPNWTAPMWEWAYSKNERVSPDPHLRMRGGEERTDAGWKAYILTGKRSLREERDRLAYRTLRETELKARDRKADVVELAADYYERYGDVHERFLERAEAEGYKPRDFNQAVKDLLRDREQSKIERIEQTKERTRTRENRREFFQKARPYGNY